MQRNLRTRSAAQIERILQREEQLLKQETAEGGDYFKQLYNAEVKEVVESEGSEFKTGSESAEDSFDSDFDREERDTIVSDPSGSESEKIEGERGRTVSLGREFNLSKTRKSKLDQYFKKGFDIRSFNLEPVRPAQQSKTQLKSLRKRPERLNSKTRLNYLHEVHPQSVLLRNALNFERLNLIALSKRFEEDCQQRKPSFVQSSDEEESPHFTLRSRLEPGTQTPANRLCFRSLAVFDEVFGGFTGSAPVDKRAPKAKKSSTKSVQEYQKAAELKKRERAFQTSHELSRAKLMISALNSSKRVKKSKLRT